MQLSAVEEEVAPSAASTSAPIAPAANAPTVRQRSVRVLLVESDQEDARRTRELLRSVRHTRYVVERARELAGSKACLHKSAFDICLVAHRLADGEGLEFVRVAHACGLQAPIIMLGAQNTLELDLEAMELGVADYLEKDRLDAMLLERAIRYALARQRDAERLHHLAQYDQLTGLANRALFQDRLRRALAWARRQGRLAAVMVLDLNGFKPVNDGLGHGAGDQLLREVARRLTTRLRETDTVARFGGDEFALIIENLARPEHAVLVARKLLDAITPPLILDGHTVRVTASLGTAIYPQDGEDPATLLRRADAAMYRAKAQGGNLCRFSDAGLDQRIQHDALAANDLKRALAQGEFVLLYQPQVTLCSAELGISALLHWRHPRLGAIDAERFLPLVQEAGLLDALTAEVFALACRQLRLWQDFAPGGLHLALPLLTRQPPDWNSIAEHLERALHQASLPSEQVEVELSEELLLADADTGGRGMARLRDLGVRIALDGFGRGPTSLRGLRLGVLATLKLARELLQEVPEAPARAAVVSALIRLARELGLRVVAEGVDTQAQLAFLRLHGCSAVQALTRCPPLSADACTRWLRQASLRRDRVQPGAPVRPWRPPAAIVGGSG